MGKEKHRQRLHRGRRCMSWWKNWRSICRRKLHRDSKMKRGGCEMGKYKAVIFDLDGTILNTIADLTDAINDALQKNGFQTYSIFEIQQLVGNGISKLIERSVPSGTDAFKIEQVHKDFTAYYSLHCADKTKPYNGIEQLLIQLKKEHYQTAVISNKANYAVQILCAKYFPTLFDVVTGECTGIPKKPDTKMLDITLQKLQCSRSEIIYVGDSEVDLKMAQNAGVICISVDWGFRDKSCLIAHGASRIASNVTELAEQISLCASDSFLEK